MHPPDPLATHGPLLTRDPLDRNHPYVSGMVGLWLPLAPWDGGKAIYDLGGRYPATFTGALTWERTAAGAGVSGFSTSLYAAMDAAAAKLSGTYPVAIAAMTTLAANGAASTAISVGNSGSTAILSLSLNTGGTANQASYFLNNGTTNFQVAASSLTFADGLPHVTMGISYSATDHRFYFDGQPVATSTTSLTAATLNVATIGAFRRSTITNPFLGKVVAAAAWAGNVPHPFGLARDWLSGTFVAVRRRPSRAVLRAAATTRKVPWHLFFNRSA